MLILIKLLFLWTALYFILSVIRYIGLILFTKMTIKQVNKRINADGPFFKK